MQRHSLQSWWLAGMGFNIECPYAASNQQATCRRLAAFNGFLTVRTDTVHACTCYCVPTWNPKQKESRGRLACWCPLKWRGGCAGNAMLWAGSGGRSSNLVGRTSMPHLSRSPYLTCAWSYIYCTKKYWELTRKQCSCHMRRPTRSHFLKLIQ